ncbi:MAG: hypothetical protein CMP21_07710 [Rickettsiales bacterium]|nr:hypothetical protein [Rickettsiales bacterium]|tara:strand:- start:860 stop:2107 length:1248 start_codon:yes stop_codon:yes gene_type:complete
MFLLSASSYRLQKNQRKNGLQQAVLNNNIEQVKALLQKGNVHKNTNDFKEDALYLAISKGYIDVVRLLLAANVSVNAVDRDGYTPLHVAVINGKLDIARLLIDHNANVNAVSSNELSHVPLHNAVISGNTNMVRLLIKSEVNVDVACQSNKTALLYAVESFKQNNIYKDIIELLIMGGANLNIRFNVSQKTPLDLLNSINPDVLKNFHEKLLNIIKNNKVQLNNNISQKKAIFKFYEAKYNSGQSLTDHEIDVISNYYQAAYNKYGKDFFSSCPIRQENFIKFGDIDGGNDKSKKNYIVISDSGHWFFEKEAASWKYLNNKNPVTNKNNFNIFLDPVLSRFVKRNSAAAAIQARFRGFHVRKNPRSKDLSNVNWQESIFNCGTLNLLTKNLVSSSAGKPNFYPKYRFAVHYSKLS